MNNSNVIGDSTFRSSLENYTSNNTRQHDTTRVQHEYNTRQHDTTRVQHETTRHSTGTTRVKYEYKRHNTSTIRHNTSTIRNTSTTRPNTSTKEAFAAKIGLYFALFVTELYIFLISFRNS